MKAAEATTSYRNKRELPHPERPPAPPAREQPQGRAIYMQWALCFDKRTQTFTVSRNDIAKRYDFLEIKCTGTYNQVTQAKREAEAAPELHPANTKKY